MTRQERTLVWEGLKRISSDMAWWLCYFGFSLLCIVFMLAFKTESVMARKRQARYGSLFLLLLLWGRPAA
jgi:hypothetical protein